VLRAGSVGRRGGEGLDDVRLVELGRHQHQPVRGVSLASAVLTSAGSIVFEWADALILLAALVSLLLIRGPLRGRKLRWHRKQS
jgi:hypothetical protein